MFAYESNIPGLYELSSGYMSLKYQANRDIFTEGGDERDRTCLLYTSTDVVVSLICPKTLIWQNYTMQQQLFYYFLSSCVSRFFYFFHAQ